MSIEPTRPPFPPPPPPAPVRAARAAMDATVLEMGAEPADESPRSARPVAPEIGTRASGTPRAPATETRGTGGAPRVMRGEADHGPEFRTPADRARAALLAGDPSGALDALDTQTAGDLLDPEARTAARSPVTLGLRAQARLDQGEPAAAFDDAARGLADAPRSLALRWTAAQAAAALGAPDAAAALLAPLVDAADAAIAAAERARARTDAAGASGTAEQNAKLLAASRPDAPASGGAARPLLAAPPNTAASAGSSDLQSSSAETSSSLSRDASAHAPALSDDPRAARAARHVARHRPGARAYATAAALERTVSDAPADAAAAVPARVPATTRAAMLRFAGGLVAHLGDGHGADGVALFARDAAKRLDGGQGLGDVVRAPEASPAAAAAPDGSAAGGTPTRNTAEAAARAATADAPTAGTPQVGSGISRSDALVTDAGAPLEASTTASPAPSATTASSSSAPSASSDGAVPSRRMSASSDAPSRAESPGVERAGVTPTSARPSAIADQTAQRAAPGDTRTPPPRTTLPEPYAAVPTVHEAPVLWRGDRLTPTSGAVGVAVPRGADDAPDAAGGTPTTLPVGAAASDDVALGPIVPVAGEAEAGAVPPSASLDRETLLAGLPSEIRRAVETGTAPLILEESVRRTVGLPARKEPDEPARAAATSASERATASAPTTPESSRTRPDPFGQLAPGDRSAPHFVAWLAADLASGALPLPPQPAPPIEIFELARDPAGAAARATAAATPQAIASPLPVTWRGVLRMGLIGAGVVLLAGGRPMLGTAMTAVAVWWWLGDARRAARQATWSTRPTIE